MQVKKRESNEEGGSTKRKKMIQAGRLVIGVAYTVASMRDGPKERADKAQMTSAAREAINLRYSWQKCEVLLAANFTSKDLFVTLTYDDGHLPATREVAVKCMKRWIAKLRAARKLRGEVLKYIYVTEQLSSEGGRLHHHIVINGTGNDYEDIRSLWEYGDGVDIKPLEVGGNDDGYEVVAKYLTKEARVCGKTEVGVRTWTPSLGLTRPKPEVSELADNETISAPPGAYILSAPAPSRNEFGEFVYIKYLLPAERRHEHPLRRPPKRKRKSEFHAFQS